MIGYNYALCDSDSIFDWNNSFVFDLFQIISACRFRNAYARSIFIELFINKTSLYSFFFFFFLYKLMCADVRMTSFVYYEDDFSRVLQRRFLSYIMKYLFFDHTLTAKVSLKFNVCILHAIRLPYNNISIFNFFYLWLFDFESFCYFLQ